MSGKVEALKEFLAMATKAEELVSAINKSAAELTASHRLAQTANLGALPAPQPILARMLTGEMGKRQDLLVLARQVHGENLATETGKAIAEEIDRTAANSTALKESLREEGLLGKDGKFAGNPKALSPQERAARLQRSLLATAQGPSNRSLANEAIGAMTDAGAVQKLRAALPGVLPNAAQDIDEFAQQLLAAAKLRPDQAKAFLKLLQEKACDSLHSRLVTVLRSLDKAGLAAENEQSLLGQIELAYLKQQPGSASLKAFRQDLGDLGSDLVDAVATGIPDRPAFIRKLLDVFVTSDEAGKVLSLAFDDAGVTRLFEDWGRFRKVYTPKRAIAAARSLLGWLYEASSFNRTELQKAAGAVATAWADGLKGFGVKVTGVTYHFNVSVAGREATDHLADLTLTLGEKSVRVIGVAIEQKAESDILYGVRQLESIPTRYAGKVMVSENGPFVIGKDMYVDLGEALATLLNKEKGDLAPAIAGLRVQENGQTYRSIVIYAPESAAGLREVKDGVLRVGHEITRQRMSSLFTSLAFAFNVAPRRL